MAATLTQAQALGIGAVVEVDHDFNEPTCNFHLNSGIFFRRFGEELHVVRAKDFNDPGELICKTDLSGLASVIATISPNRELNGSYAYILEFLKDGTMFCGGCGCRMRPGDPHVGSLSIVNVVACKTCYEQKFKPLFDWGMESAKRH